MVGRKRERERETTINFVQKGINSLNSCLLLLELSKFFLLVLEVTFPTRGRVRWKTLSVPCVSSPTWSDSPSTAITRHGTDLRSSRINGSKEPILAPVPKVEAKVFFSSFEIPGKAVVCLFCVHVEVEAGLLSLLFSPDPPSESSP